MILGVIYAFKFKNKVKKIHDLLASITVITISIYLVQSHFDSFGYTVYGLLLLSSYVVGKYVKHKKIIFGTYNSVCTFNYMAGCYSCCVRGEINMKKKVMFILGWLSFIVGMIGVVFPILPTTPFILLATFLFANSSHKCEAWIKQSKVYRKYVLEYKRNNGLSMKQKIEIIFMTSILLGISAIVMENTHLRIFLLALFLVKLTVLWIYIPTSNERAVIK